MDAILDNRRKRSGGAKMTNSVVWEDGYKICLDSFKLADKLEEHKKTLVSNKLRETALHVLFDLSRMSKSKPSRAYIKKLKRSYASVKRASTLMMFIHDLNYLDTNEYLELTGEMNIFQNKLKKIIKYNERKLKKM